MASLNLFLPLMKVDVDQRMVHGVVTAEQPDRSGEICDYESTKPYFEAWSQQASDVTKGKSLGAVRAMHGAVAAGKLTDIAFDDANKRILVAAKIVDDDEWNKVLEGVYTSPRARDKTSELENSPKILTFERAVLTVGDACRLHGNPSIFSSYPRVDRGRRPRSRGGLQPRARSSRTQEPPGREVSNPRSCANARPERAYARLASRSS